MTYKSCTFTRNYEKVHDQITERGGRGTSGHHQ